MKFYYFYIPNNIAKAGAVYLIYFIVMALFSLLVIVNFRFRVNRVKKQSKNDTKPLVYIIPHHVDHVQKYVDPIEYIALKNMIFNENEGHHMRVYKEYTLNNTNSNPELQEVGKKTTKSLRKKGNYWDDENKIDNANKDGNADKKMGDSRFIRNSKLAKEITMEVSQIKYGKNAPDTIE